ncbi:cell division protein FtsQ/DivIB [Pelobacter seleniigenes]|uniref:cell division protein FtsQ/DivIB n=1 Tax=Pelobacter seleniigenes TaxID=407188 RepID=UPI0004A70153|nr:FtsQ-type POTRA domain-containing protein [Pelobacter seleniigenes]
MRDLKSHQQKTRKVRRNRRKQERKPLEVRKFLHRALRVGVALFSAALVVVGGFFLVQLLMASDMFRIDTIDVTGNTRLTREQIVLLSDIEPGVNTFSLDLGMIGHKIEENPWVKQARVQRIFPRQVKITLVERKPVAIINLGYLYYLDDHGEIFKVLDSSDQLDFPVVTGFDYERAQQHETEYAQLLKQIVTLIADLKQRKTLNLAQVSEIHRTAENGLTLLTMNGGVAIKLGWDHFARKIDRLEQIYAQLQPKLPILDYIDLNVDEKVIVRIQRSKTSAKS